MVEKVLKTKKQLVLNFYDTIKNKLKFLIFDQWKQYENSVY